MSKVKKQSKPPLKICGLAFTPNSLRDQFSKKSLALIWCKLNAWETPSEMPFPRKLEEEEITELFKLVAKIVPRSDWLPAWQNFIKRDKEIS